MSRTQGEVDVSRVISTVRAAEQVDLVSEADLERMARAVLNELDKPPRISHASPRCPGCDSVKAYFVQRKVQAWILDVNGITFHGLPS